MLPRRGKLSQIYPANSAAESKNNIHLNNNFNSNYGNELQVLKGGSDRTIAISNNNQPIGNAAASKPSISGIIPEPEIISDPTKNEYLKPILFPFGNEPRYQSVQQGYDPYQIPPDYQLALKHRVNK